MHQLTDNDLMPFGDHKGKFMKDVPARYLFWCWTTFDDFSPVKDYIKRNMSALKKEYPDGIWEE